MTNSIMMSFCLLAGLLVGTIAFRSSSPPTGVVVCFCVVVVAMTSLAITATLSG